MHAPAPALLDRAAKKNLFLLSCCQAIGQAGSIMMLSATALAVVTFFPQRELATLPITMQHFGVMFWVFPASMLMQWRGRRFGYQFGSLFGIAGSATAATGVLLGNFWLLCLAGFLLGYAVSCQQMYRFGAMELAPASYRGKAVAWVTAGGIVSGILGPSLVQVSFEAMMPIYFGTYLSMILLHVIVLAIMSFIQFPKIQGEDGKPADDMPPRPLLQIVRQPKYIASVVAAMTSFGTMSFVMAASPLAIVGCGLPRTEVQLVIFMHVMGMFVPSLFTGNLISRYGVLNVMSVGAFILLAGVLIAMHGITDWHFRIALTLNGVGWNFVFVGATVAVASCYRVSERGKAQALNDFLVFGTTATSSFFAGLVQETHGWLALNIAAITLVSIAGLAVIRLITLRRAEAAT